MAITSVLCDITMQSLVWDRVSAIRKFIYDTPGHKGQKGVTMVTNFGTKIAISALQRKITRMWLLITGFFLCWSIQRGHFSLQRFKVCCHDNQILDKIGNKSHKNGHNLSCEISVQICFEIGFSYQLIHLWHSRTPGTGALIWQPILGLKFI